MIPKWSDWFVRCLWTIVQTKQTSVLCYFLSLSQFIYLTCNARNVTWELMKHVCTNWHKQSADE